MEDLLRVTSGDVEWAVDVFLQSGYADGLSCERPPVKPSSDEEGSDSSEDSSSDLSPDQSSPELSEEAAETGEVSEESVEPPRLTLDREFLRAAHRKFGEEFSVTDLDIGE